MANNQVNIAKVPYHLGIIMDGNGRWARQRNLPRLEGHRAGTENLRTIIRACVEFNVKILTIYAFSTENWNRPAIEVTGLLHIFESVIDKELNELHEEGVSLRHLGTLDGMAKKLQNKVRHAIEMTSNNDQLILNVAFDYGGRAEIIQAIRKMLADGVSPDAVDEDLFSQYLFTANLPDPDLIVRTSGEFRLSNFLLWQSAYTEYYITPTFWPAFDRDEFIKALKHYAQRERRFGALT